MLFDDHGKALWDIGLPGVGNLAWTTDGKLLALARDLIELSPVDGSIVYAQCGWSFGRRTMPNKTSGKTAISTMNSCSTSRFSGLARSSRP